jgi:hypothetical protein
MAITVGTDTYVTLAEANSYFTTHLNGATPWASATTDQREQALRQATKDIDARQYKGVVTVTGQALEFPRNGIADRRGETVTATTVPDAVKLAQYEQAFHVLDSHDAPNVAAGPFVNGEVLPETFTPDLSDTALRHLWVFLHAGRVVRG